MWTSSLGALTKLSTFARIHCCAHKFMHVLRARSCSVFPRVEPAGAQNDRAPSENKSNLYSIWENYPRANRFDLLTTTARTVGRRKQTTAATCRASMGICAVVGWQHSGWTFLWIGGTILQTIRRICGTVCTVYLKLLLTKKIAIISSVCTQP